MIQEETEDADKDRIDMAVDIDHIAETEVHTIVVGIEGTIRTTIIMVMEAIDLSLEITKTIGTMIGPITEVKILTKTMAKEIEIEA